MGKCATGQIAPEPHLLERPLKPLRPGLFSGYPEQVLGAARIPLLDPKPLTSQLGGEPHAPFRQHSHRTQRKGKETNPKPAELSIALSEMGT